MCSPPPLSSQFLETRRRSHGMTRLWTWPPSAFWTCCPSRPTALWIWTGPRRSWMSRRDASMTSPTSWRGFSSSPRSPRTTSNGCESDGHVIRFSLHDYRGPKNSLWWYNCNMYRRIEQTLPSVKFILNFLFYVFCLLANELNSE